LICLSIVSLRELVEAFMKIGIGLPSTIPGVSGSLIREWARLAEDGPFSSLAVLDRLIYENFDPLTTLAVVAGATRRIRLTTAVLLAPLRNTRVLAKQVASLDALSNGRLTLGLGVGGREDDYRAAEVSFHNRGKRLEQQLDSMTRLWAGQPVDDQTGPIGPPSVQAGGPEILIGAYAPAAINRLERWGHGFLAAGSDARQVSELFGLAEAAWQRSGKPGKPRLVADVVFALGPDAAARSTAYMLDYYAFLGPMAQYMAASVLVSQDEVKATIQAYEKIGTDELLFIPCIPELDQVRLLAECFA
jgi:alkanesulfonate monooxygenase SsuD/methylene tetrahydromethanopterin reductase-like flavin-dependent oxidoreductase (luciferase family)